MQLSKMKPFSIAKTLAIAVISASIVSTSIAAVVAPLFDVRSIDNILGSWVLYLFYIVAFEIFIGVPIALLLYRFDLIEWKIWLPAAVLAGFFITFFFMSSNVTDNMYGYVLIMSISALSAAIFRAVWEILRLR